MDYKYVFIGFKTDGEVPDDYIKKIIYTALVEGAKLGLQLEEIRYNTMPVPEDQCL